MTELERKLLDALRPFAALKLWRDFYPDGPDMPAASGQHIPAKDIHAARTPDRRAVMEWQPIETAPRDGTRFLAYEPSEAYRIYECWWQEDFSNWEGWQNDWDSEPDPTHWMPLPPPPQTDQHQ